MATVTASALVLLVVASRTVVAVFSSQSTATVVVTVPIPDVPEPDLTNCVGTGVPLVGTQAVFTWTAPPGGVLPTKYVIRTQVEGQEELVVDNIAATATTYTLTAGLLTGDMAWLTDLLQNTSTLPPVTVNAVYGAYESTSDFDEFRLRWSFGLLSGVGCEAIP